MLVNNAVDFVTYTFSISPAIPTATSLVVVQPAPGVLTNVAPILMYDWTLDPTQVNYTITITATVDGDETFRDKIILPVINSCLSAVISIPITGFAAPLDTPPHTLTYTVGFPAAFHNPFPIGTTNPSNCEIRTEIKGRRIGNPITTLTPTSTPISYNDYTRTLTIYTISGADAGTYDL